MIRSWPRSSGPRRASGSGSGGCGWSGASPSETSRRPESRTPTSRGSRRGGGRAPARASPWSRERLGGKPGYLETGSDLADSEARELRLADMELRLRLEGEIDRGELQAILEDAIEHADVATAARARIAIGMDAAARGEHAAAIAALEA